MHIRHAQPSDAEGCLAIYGPFAADTAVSFEDEAPSAQEFQRRIERVTRTHCFLVAVDDDEIAGFAYAGMHRERGAYRWATESSVYIAESHRGQGLGHALCEALFALLQEQGYRTVLAGITVPNPGSVALHRALGFEQVGTYRRIGWKAGEWRDVVWLALQLGPDTQEQQTPASPGAPVRLAYPIEL